MVVDLPLGKIGRVEAETLQRLKKANVTTVGQLVIETETCEQLAVLARCSGIAIDDLKRVAERAKLRQIKGIGTIFEIMLELAGVAKIADLAAERPDDLHRRLADLNQIERLARRSPTLDEVEEWVGKARGMTAKNGQSGVD